MTPHLSGDYRLNVQLLARLTRIDLLALVTGDNTARHDAQLRQLRKTIDQALGDLVIYIFSIRIGRFIDKWKDRNRLNRIRLASLTRTREVHGSNNADDHETCDDGEDRSSLDASRLTDCVGNRDDRRRGRRGRRDRQLSGAILRSPVRFRDKPVPAPRHRLDKLHAARSFTERFSQKRDVLREISLFDKRVWPDTLHQIVL